MSDICAVNGSVLALSQHFLSSWTLDENKFVFLPTLIWMQNYWTSSLWICAVYLLVIFSIQAYMKSRLRFILRKPLAIWNLFLAIFSIFGCWKMLPQMWSLVQGDGGFHGTVCKSIFESTPSWVFWSWLFTLSKFPELVDTLFIVLRKQKLIFLHYYHHVSVLIFAWYCFANAVSTARWYVVMNYVVHALMYSYYALRAMRVKVPEIVPLFITTVQILQMVIGLWVNLVAYMTLRSGDVCHVPYHGIFWGIAIYLSYFALFAHFFYGRYVSNYSLLTNGSKTLKKIH